MISLLLATLFSAGFSLVVRYAQGTRRNLWAVGATNYVLATLFHLARALSREALPPATPTLVLGLVTGMIYMNSYALMLPFMRLRGVSISMAVSRLAVLLPVIGSVVLWGERVTSLQSLGALLAIMALPFLGFSPKAGEQRMSRSHWLLLIALFTSNGLGMFVIEAFHQTGTAGQDSLFLAALFGAAGVIALVVWFLKRRGSSSQDILPGVALGLCNALANLFLVAALDALPSVLVFPFYSAVGVAVTTFFARLVWQERINRFETVGMAMAIGAVVFINIA